MKVTRAVVLAGLLTLSATLPANAQDAVGQAGWVDWGSRIVHQSIDTFAYPFRKAWAMAWEALGDSESAVAEEKSKFVTKLKQDLGAFTKDVQRTGYDVSNISISPDIIPKISLTLEVREPVSDPVEAELRTEFQNRKNIGVIEREILLSLLDLDETAADLKVDGYRFSDVEFALEFIVPEVTLNFEREDAVAPEPAADPSVSKTKASSSQVLSN